MAQREGGTDGQKISPLYKTLFPIGAVALFTPMKTREVDQGKGTPDHLISLDRGEILYVYPSVHPSFHLSS